MDDDIVFTSEIMNYKKGPFLIWIAAINLISMCYFKNLKACPPPPPPPKKKKSSLCPAYNKI